MGGVRRVIRLSSACAACALALQTLSCSPFFLPPLRIVAWSPAVERPDPSGSVEVWVEFSAPVDRTKAEAAFTLKEGSAVLPGSFSWQGNRMTFIPYQAISAGKDYELIVLDTVETERGVSLEADFHFDFSTKSDTGRPVVLGCSPVNNATIDDRYAPVVIVFSEPVDSPSFYRAFSLSPPVEGSFSWSADGATCTFTPIQPYTWQTEYLLNIQCDLTDIDGNGLAEEFSSHFSIGSDTTPPVVASVGNVAGGVPGSELIPVDDPTDGVVTVKELWECGWGFAVRFSEPVLRDSIESYLVFSPGWLYELDCPSEASDYFILQPKERLAYDTLYTLTVRKGVTDQQGNKTPEDLAYRFRINGPASKPPVVARLRFRLNPADPPESAAYAEYAPQDAFLSLNLAAFPVGSTLPGYIDCYFALAQEAGINLMSLMEAFSISTTNGCASFAITAIQATGFDEPQPEPVAGAVPARIHLDIGNAAASGIVTLKLSADFIDSAGNPIAAAWQLPLLK
jgi:hypothetical protein